jgi:hypothetical protein
MKATKLVVVVLAADIILAFLYTLYVGGVRLGTPNLALTTYPWVSNRDIVLAFLGAAVLLILPVYLVVMNISGLFERREKPTSGNGDKVSSSEETQLIICQTCHKQTPVPISDPPFGTPLRCVHCQSSLVSVSEPEQGSPLATSSELLHLSYGYSGRYLDHPHCPWCQKINYSIVFPAKGRSIGWYAVREPENPQAFRIEIKCMHCDKDFYVEWDENPL